MKSTNGYPTKHRLIVELLESRNLLSAVGFVSHDIARSDVLFVEDVLTADVDGDDDMDAVLLSSLGGVITWYQNTDGKGTFGEQQVITSTTQAMSAYAADLDGDGDVDFLSASLGFRGESKILWYENDSKGTFGEQQVIATVTGHPSPAVAADLDGDGDMDVLTASVSGINQVATIAWYENIDGAGSFGPQQLIIADAGIFPGELLAADMDGDGDLDVLDSKAWYENTDGKGTYGARQVIAADAQNASSQHVADVDGDGDLDVLSRVWPDTIAWYENTDGNGNFADQQVITTGTPVRSVHAADLDGDGDMDVLSASEGDGKVAWYENTDGRGTFGPQQVISTIAQRASWVLADDLDGDGDVDVLSASWNDGVAWYENTDGRGSFGAQATLSNLNPLRRPTAAYPTDVDGDGDQDVISVYNNFSDNRIVWYDNTDGRGTFREERIIVANSARWGISADVMDFDGDGDVDVLSASTTFGEKRFAWHENTDGKGTFGASQAIDIAFIPSERVVAVDLDGDGDVDLISASPNDFPRKMVWHENTNGKGTFAPEQVITHELSQPGTNRVSTLDVADVDADGDADVVSVLFQGPIMTSVWYENTDGRGNFGSQRVMVVTDARLWSLRAADVDGDGDADMLSVGDSEIGWFENTDGEESFGAHQVITTEAQTLASIYAADVDGDGDLDVVSASNLGELSGLGEHKLAWYENTDGEGTFGKQQVITTETKQARSVYAADMDGDGDVDVLSASELDDRIAWYENRLAGDTDDNGEVSFDDFLVLSANFGKAADAVWEDGDFDGNGAVDFADFLLLSDNFGSKRPTPNP